MFKKIPYGVKVRVKGKSGVGYKAEVCITYSRFFPGNIWSPISSRKSSWTNYVFDTREEAQEAAMLTYNDWIKHYEREAEKQRKLKSVPNGTVWEFP